MVFFNVVCNVEGFAKVVVYCAKFYKVNLRLKSIRKYKQRKTIGQLRIV
jgi:hypothetical protein